MSNIQDFTIENSVLTRYTGPGGDVVIPEGITEIGDWAFSNCTGLTSVTIPEGVTEIGGSVFYGCTSLSSVTIPEGVTEIRSWSFFGCTDLTSVIIPEGVTKIGGCAFGGCTNLQSVMIPESVMEIGEVAFQGCKNLKSVTILGRFEKIDKSAFQGCHPMLLAARSPIGAFWADDKPGAISGFAKLYLKDAEINEEIRAGYFKYIKGNKSKIHPLAIENEEILQMMMQEKLITRKDVDLLMDESDKQRNYTAKAAIMQYNHENFQ